MCNKQVYAGENGRQLEDGICLADRREPGTSSLCWAEFTAVLEGIDQIGSNRHADVERSAIFKST